MTANRAAYGDTVWEMARTNDKIVVVDSDCIGPLNYQKFVEDFPNRFFECGIAEQDMVSTAAGLASCGLTAFCASFAVFVSMRALDQVRNQVCYNRLNVKMIGTHCGIETGYDGATHQAIEDLAVMRAIPNLVVLAPSTPIMTGKLTRVMADTYGPFYMRFGRNKNEEIYTMDDDFRIGGSKRIYDGGAVTVMTHGSLLPAAKEAVEELRREGVDARLSDMYSLKPIDTEEIESAARETGLILTVEDHSVVGGLGGAVCEYTAEHCPCRVVRMGMNDAFGRAGTTEDLYRLYGLTAEGIVRKIKAVLS